MPDRYGASPDRWAYYSTTLGLTADLLPVISNPNATISPRSTLRALGKTPSLYNHDREAVGIAKWTQHQTTPTEIARWSAEPDLGIAIQTRRLRAIDVDVEDETKAKALTQAIDAFTGCSMPIRWRGNSGKRLMIFTYEGNMPKRVLPVDGGMIELLGNGQQFIAEGTHPSGASYCWDTTYDDDDILRDIPLLEEEALEKLWTMLCTIYGTGEPRIARQRKELNGAKPLNLHDPVAEWLVDNWEIYDVGQENQIFMACPFADGHSTDTGSSSTAYFPAGTGGYSEGNFVCLHASCTGRDQAEYLNATGYVASAFDDLSGASDAEGGDADGVLLQGEGAAPHGDAGGVSDRADRQAQIATARWPRLKRDKTGVLPTMDNFLLALASPSLIGRRLALDAFREELVWSTLEEPAQWCAFKDSDYARLRQVLEKIGFKPFGIEMLRLAVLTTAEDNAFDTAREWLDRLTWDGVPRVEEFAMRGWGWLPGPYSGAVSRYVWTALAGRVLEPGVQCDMAPILVGAQGIRKTTAIKAMVPSSDNYLSIKLDAHDDDSSRKIRGKLVIELEELRGLNTRAMEEIKAWITRTHEEWVPKWREFSTKFPRRGVFFGSTNEDEILADPTGERRWLPGRCGLIDVDWIIANRDQLWAEGAILFGLDGVDWRDAERLARVEHSDYKIADAWEPFVRAWLLEDQIAGPGGKTGRPVDWDCVTAADALQGAISLPLGQIDHARKVKMAKILRSIGLVWTRKRDGGELISGWIWPGTK